MTHLVLQAHEVLLELGLDCWQWHLRFGKQAVLLLSSWRVVVNERACSEPQLT